MSEKIPTHRIKKEELPKLPNLSIDEMLLIAINDPESFQQIAINAGHRTIDTFISLLKRTQQESMDRAKSVPFDAHSLKKYLNPPNLDFEQYYNELEMKANKLLNSSKGSSLRGRLKIIASYQDAYTQIYEREKHKMIYDRILKGMELDKAFEEVSLLFRERSTSLLTKSDLPLDFREAESKAMLGIHAKPIGDVDITSDATGSAEKFNIHETRKRLDGKKHWPRGKPDGSNDE